MYQSDDDYRERLLQYLTKKAEMTGSKSITIKNEELANEMGMAEITTK